MFGTIKSVSVSMNGYSEGEPEFLTSVLVGPAANTGATLDFFSRAGGPNSSGTLNLVLSDAGGSLAPQSALSSGTFKPTSYNPMLTADTYTPTISGFYALPATYNYAPTFGTSTFASVFQGTSPNGNWDLYFNQTGDNHGGGLATGWCLNLTANPPALTIGKTHTGNFVQGQQGAQFAITVTNSGPGSAGGAIPVTVTDAMPVGLTPVSGSGTGWNCPAPSGQTITCTNANVVASGDSYPTLTLNVNVATGAPASVSNTASVNGSGNTVAVTSLADTVTILPPPALSISKAPSGTFTQGQTAIWDITVSNKAGSNPTSGTVTVVDTLPNGYTFASNTGTGWTCGAVTVTVTCTSTTALAGGASFPALAITVNVPANSPISVTNNAAAFGGGDPAHTSLGTAVTATSPVTVTQVPATINITAGNNQSVTIGSALPVNLAVTVLDADGVAINGATVTFTAPATGASGTFAGGTNVKTATTNSAGLATATVFTTNFVAGSYSISAAAGSISKNFSVTNNPGPASIMTANAGTTPQSATINTAFANALAVTVTDAHNNPVSGVAIQFTAPGSGASGLFSNSSTQFQPMTNASGVATAPFTANGIAGGPYSVTAAASGLTQLSFSLTNLTGAVASITANAGTTPQSATVNTAFANALAVTVKDAGTNPISGANVVFTAPSTGASGTFSNSTNTITVPTNGLGVASAPFTANGTAGGSYSVSAMVGGLAASFSLTNTAVVAISPTVVSYSVQWGAETYNVIGTPRNRLPWQITGIQVVFSEPITTGNVNSLTGTGITTTGFSGLGTNTLTWTITPIALGNFPTVLAGSGANALKDMNGNALANGAGYNQNLKILYGDFNDDGVVNAQDLELVGIAMSAPYNLFADLNGDGVVNIADYSIVRSRLGTSLP